VGEVADVARWSPSPSFTAWSRSIVARTPTGTHELPLLRSVLGARQPPARHHAGAAADLLQPDLDIPFYLAARHLSPARSPTALPSCKVCPSDLYLIARVFTRAGCCAGRCLPRHLRRRCVLRDRSVMGDTLTARSCSRDLLGLYACGHRPTGAQARAGWPGGGCPVRVRSGSSSRLPFTVATVIAFLVIDCVRSSPGVGVRVWLRCACGLLVSYGWWATSWRLDGEARCCPT